MHVARFLAHFEEGPLFFRVNRYDNYIYARVIFLEKCKLRATHFSLIFVLLVVDYYVDNIWYIFFSFILCATVVTAVVDYYV